MHEFNHCSHMVQRRAAGLLRMHVLGSVRSRIEVGAKCVCVCLCVCSRKRPAYTKTTACSLFRIGTLHTRANTLTHTYTHIHTQMRTRAHTRSHTHTCTYARHLVYPGGPPGLH